MPDDEKDLKTFDEVLADLERLPALHLGRIWLDAMKAIRDGALEATMLEGDDRGPLVWVSTIVVGALADGRPRFHIYPSGTGRDDLEHRDASVAGILALPGPAEDAADLLALAAKRPSTTFAVYARARAGGLDGAPITGLYRHPSLTLAQAIGWLKLTVDYVRKLDADARKGGS